MASVVKYHCLCRGEGVVRWARAGSRVRCFRVNGRAWASLMWDSCRSVFGRSRAGFLAKVIDLSAGPRLSAGHRQDIDVTGRIGGVWALALRRL